MGEARRARAWRPKLNGSAIAAGLIGALLYSEILLFGANGTELAMAFAGLWYLALGLTLTNSWARRALDQARVVWIGVSFAGALLAALLTLTPFAPGGASSTWSWVTGARSIASIDPYLTLVEILKLLALAAAFLIGVVVGADEERAKSLIRWILRLGLIYSLWAFTDRVTNPTLLFGAARSFDPSRLSASLMSANTAATFFGTLVLLNLIDLDRAFRRYRRVDSQRLERVAPKVALASVGLAAAATCLILTLSRAGLAATAAVTIVLIGAAGVARARRGVEFRLIFAIVGILAGIVLISFATNLGPLENRLNVLNDAALNRSAIFAAHWEAFKAAPDSGYGLGSFGHVNGMIMNQTDVSALHLLGAAHNVYLQWLEQAGLVGATPMFICVGLIALQIARGAAEKQRMRSWLIGILAVLALFLIHGVTDYAFEVPAMATLLSLLTGLGVGVSSDRSAVAGGRSTA